MVTKLKDVDVVTIGVGMTGAMLAKEFTLAGLTVVGLERGPDRRPHEEAGQFRRHHHLPQRLRADRTADSPLGRVPTR